MMYCLTDHNRVNEWVNFPSIAKPHSVTDVIALGKNNKTWTYKPVSVDCSLRRTWNLWHNQRSKFRSRFWVVGWECHVRTRLDKGCIFYSNKMMCLCLKTYGIVHLMTQPINGTNVLNLSLFFSKGFLKTEGRNNAPSFTPCSQN